MNSVSDAVLADASPEIVVHLFRRQLGCLQRMAHSAAAGSCIIMLGCWQSLCRREQREYWCRDPDLQHERRCIDTCVAQE
jgi:hypothetical protein